MYILIETGFPDLVVRHASIMTIGGVRKMIDLKS
jgi:hypothetical protein